MKHDKDPRTIAASHGVGTDKPFRPIAPPIYLTSTFAFAGFERSLGYEYTRSSNPTRDLLAETLAALEGGSGAVITSTGTSAIDLVLSIVRQGELIVAPHDCYGGTYRLLTARRDRGQFDIVFVDQNDDAALAAALARRPKLVLVETPSNPLMRVIDIRKVVDLSHASGAQVAVDNTFLSPALQRPLMLGADFVIHSTTKYLNGHSDIVGGAVVAARQSDVNALATWANTTGVTGAPFDAHLTLRGLRTLFARVERQQMTAMSLANVLADHPSVAAVHYPGLASHPGHALAAAQQDGFGAMLSFELKGDTNSVRRFVESVKVFTLAESLGGIESLVSHPATMTHLAMAPEARKAAGIGDNLIRLSIGLEGEDDLISDLEQALAAASQSDDYGSFTFVI